MDGIEYTIRDCDQLRRLIQQERWEEVERTCTSFITDFSYLFEGAKDFNGSIGHWDTSNVIDMKMMFRDASAFNQPIGDWDTSSVMYMEQMLVALRWNHVISYHDKGSSILAAA